MKKIALFQANLAIKQQKKARKIQMESMEKIIHKFTSQQQITQHRNIP